MIVGSIAYSKSKVIPLAEDREPLETVTFGPISVHPSYKRRGVGTAMMQHTANIAKEKGYPAIVIYGDPNYYSRVGFRLGEGFDMRNPKNKYAVALQVMILQNDLPLQRLSGRYKESPAFDELDLVEFEAFDASFPAKEKISGLATQARFQFLISLVYPPIKAFQWEK